MSDKTVSVLRAGWEILKRAFIILIVLCVLSLCVACLSRLLKII
jgi:hypothetical protein